MSRLDGQYDDVMTGQVSNSPIDVSQSNVIIKRHLSSEESTWALNCFYGYSLCLPPYVTLLHHKTDFTTDRKCLSSAVNCIECGLAYPLKGNACLQYFGHSTMFNGFPSEMRKMFERNGMGLYSMMMNKWPVVKTQYYYIYKLYLPIMVAKTSNKQKKKNECGIHRWTMIGT